MALKVGSEVWIPCEVKPGPSLDERMVRVLSEEREWLGFVHTSWLREPNIEGHTSIRATVVSVRGNAVVARLPGHAPLGRTYRGSTEDVELAEAP